MIESVWQTYRDEWEDFWGRRQNEARFYRVFRIYGREVRLTSNDEGVLTAVSHVLPLYSRCPHEERPLGEIQLVVQQPPVPPGLPPDDLMQAIWYSGADDWLMIRLDRWGQAFADLSRRRTTAVLAPELAQKPELLAHCLLNTILLNYIIADGYGMLHASCLWRDGQAVLLLAPHNTGKSTTALQLVMHGFQLLADSMVFVDRVGRLFGFPVGKIRLRADVRDMFPLLQPHLQPVVVRNETKYLLDLREVSGERVAETAVVPQRITLCLLHRHTEKQTRMEPATKTAVWDAVMRNSLYYDRPQIWQANLAQLTPLITQAEAWHLYPGTKTAELVQKILTQERP